MSFDADLFLVLNQAFSGPWVSRFFMLVTRFGDGLVLIAVILPLMFFFRRTDFKRHILALVISVAASGLIVNGLKVAVDRPRPPEHFAGSGVEVHAPLGSPPDRSFPSGHTQTAFGAAVYLACMYRSLSLLFLTIASLVGLSRIALGVHFPADVAVGALFGSVFSVAGYRINERRLRNKK